MPRKRLTLDRKKRIAGKILGSKDIKENNDVIAKEEGVSSDSVRRIRTLIKKGDSLTEEDIKNHPSIRRVYDKSLAEWIGQARKRIANITLNNAVKFLQEAQDPDKIKKMSAAQAQLSGKIALDTALLATGQMPQGDAPSVKIYLPEASNKNWKIVKETPIDITDKHENTGSNV